MGMRTMDATMRRRAWQRRSTGLATIVGGIWSTHRSSGEALAAASLVRGYAVTANWVLSSERGLPAGSMPMVTSERV